jgi:hypothetical protein
MNNTNLKNTNQSKQMSNVITEKLVWQTPEMSILPIKQTLDGHTQSTVEDTGGTIGS